MAGSNRNRIFLLLIILVGLTVSAFQAYYSMQPAEPTAVLEPVSEKVLPDIGDTRARAVELMGEPEYTAMKGSIELLFYRRDEIRVADGIVVATRILGEEVGSMTLNDRSVMIDESRKIAIPSPAE